MLCLSVAHQGWPCFITIDADLDHVVMVKSAMFLHSNAAVYSFAVHKCVGRDHIEAIQIAVAPQTFSANFSIYSYCRWQTINVMF